VKRQNPYLVARPCSAFGGECRLRCVATHILDKWLSSVARQIQNSAYRHKVQMKNSALKAEFFICTLCFENPRFSTSRQRPACSPHQENFPSPDTSDTFLVSKMAQECAQRNQNAAPKGWRFDFRFSEKVLEILLHDLADTGNTGELFLQLCLIPLLVRNNL